MSSVETPTCGPQELLPLDAWRDHFSLLFEESFETSEVSFDHKQPYLRSTAGADDKLGVLDVASQQLDN